VLATRRRGKEKNPPNNDVYWGKKTGKKGQTLGPTGKRQGKGEVDRKRKNPTNGKEIREPIAHTIPCLPQQKRFRVQEGGRERKNPFKGSVRQKKESQATANRAKKDTERVNKTMEEKVWQDSRGREVDRSNGKRKHWPPEKGR